MRFFLFILFLSGSVFGFRLEGKFSSSGFSFSPPAGELSCLEWRYDLSGPVVRRDWFDSPSGVPVKVPLLSEYRLTHLEFVPAHWGESINFGQVWVPDSWVTVEDFLLGNKGFARLKKGEGLRPLYELESSFSLSDLSDTFSKIEASSYWVASGFSFLSGVCLFRFVSLRWC